MSNGKAITFIFLSSAIMMVAISMQNAKKRGQAKNPDANPDAAQVEGDKKDQEQADGKAPEAPLLADDASKDSDKQATPEKPEDKPQADADNKKADDKKTGKPAAPEVEDEFVKLGSLAPDGSDRYLVTINRKAGTLHQVELNMRKKNGRYAYRDIVFKGGYPGSWNLVQNDKGIFVKAVGNQTPADLAGLKKGDRILSFNDETIVEIDEINPWLEENTKPGKTLNVGIERNGGKMSLPIELTEKPKAIIESGDKRIDPDFDFPESFVLSLLKPTKFLERAWPDIAPGMRTQLWEVTDASTDQMVELRYSIPQSSLEKLGFKGPLVVYKRFRLPQLDDENKNDLASKSFHLGFEIEIKNESDQEQTLAYEIDGPTGTSTETYWYANKIHGRQTAIGYIAGARDVVASTGVNSYVFFGGPEIVKAAIKPTPEPQRICSPLETDPKERELKFIGVDSHYFHVGMIPETAEGETYSVLSAQAYPNNRQGVLPEIPDNVRKQKLVDCTFQMVAEAKLPPKGSFKQSFKVFCGPKEIELLRKYGLEDTRTFGWFSWCSIVLLKILHFLYFITFKTSYGLAIILLTVLVRCLMIPFSRKAALNAQMMQHLAPQMKEIADKYKDDMEKRANAQRELYKKYNFNPLGGCFMMFFQLPIFYGLYKGLNVDIALRDQPLIPGMGWCSNLAAPDQLLNWQSWMPSWLSSETGWLGPYLNILPLLTMVLFIAQQRLFTPPAQDDQQKLMQKMMTFMMLFMGIMFFKVAAGLCIYFITSSIWGIIERKMLPKPTLDTDKLALADGPVDSMSPKERKAAERAAADREAEIEDRKKRNADRKKRMKKRGQ